MSYSKFNMKVRIAEKHYRGITELLIYLPKSPAQILLTVKFLFHILLNKKNSYH